MTICTVKMLISNRADNKQNLWPAFCHVCLGRVKAVHSNLPYNRLQRVNVSIETVDKMPLNKLRNLFLYELHSFITNLRFWIHIKQDLACMGGMRNAYRILINELQRK
jgi:hypothetical protein